MTDKGRIRIGGFYELPDGGIARTFGWDGGTGLVSYHLDDGHPPVTVHRDVLAGSWTERPDLADFPGARDPRLPFEFDLNWDAKTRSGLPGLLASDDTADEARAAMARHGITLTPEEEARLDRLVADKEFEASSGYGR